jgi:hypothetical protein
MATPPDFSSGAVLTAAQMNSVGLWLVKTQTVGTTVSSVAVTGDENACHLRSSRYCADVCRHLMQ